MASLVIQQSFFFFFNSSVAVGRHDALLCSIKAVKKGEILLMNKRIVFKLEMGTMTFVNEFLFKFYKYGVNLEKRGTYLCNLFPNM